MHTLTINPQPNLRSKIENLLAPFLYGRDRCIRIYNKKFHTRVKQKARKTVSIKNFVRITKDGLMISFSF